MNIVPIILSGGSGTRLWPVSRKLHPKQFHCLNGEQTLIQQTISRIDKTIVSPRPIVICNTEHRFMIAEQLAQIGTQDAEIYLEPCARNTAPAVAVGAFATLDRDQARDSILLVLPADHLISDIAGFNEVVVQAATWASQGFFVTFGIKPDRPETGYGYIESGKDVNSGEDKTKRENPVYELKCFVEKPALDLAEKWVTSEDHFWNSGIFVFRPEDYLRELKDREPKIYDCSKSSIDKKTNDLQFYRLDPDSFEKCPSNSIDYAVMEKVEKALVIPLPGHWSDIGSWNGFWQALDKDSSGNVIKGDVVTRQVTDSVLYSNGRLIAGVGLTDIVVVETPDAVLVAKKDSDQEIKNIVAELELDSRGECSEHKQVFRPWGSYQCIDRGKRFQVKRLIVKPGEKLSLQRHQKRSEHWVVVKGTATVTRDDDTFELSENESTFIPIMSLHKLENTTDHLLEIIEIQTGDYLGEDDIERFEDSYGRV